MAGEKDRIVKMLEEGKISADDAARLLEALGGEGGGRDESGQPISRPPSSDPDAVRGDSPLKGKKLRVKVNIDGDENVNVNVALPLSLAKIADGIITNVIPKEVSKELEGQGIDLKALNLGEIVDALTDTDEDIINVDIDGDSTIKVRVHVE